MFNCYFVLLLVFSKRFFNIEKFKIKGKFWVVEFNFFVDDWGGYVSVWVEEIVRVYLRFYIFYFWCMDVFDDDLKILV